MSLGADQLASDNWEILCECAEPMAQNVGIITECGTGVMSEVPFVSGEEFTLDAYELATSGTYTLALLLPAGAWSITLVSFTGTIVPPADTSQTAYAWHAAADNSFQNVLWNAPATPADFGTQDTGRAAFAPWCAGQVWNAVLFNDAPFSATFTAVPV